MNSFKKVSLLALLSFLLILGVGQSTIFAASVGDPLDNQKKVGLVMNLMMKISHMAEENGFEIIQVHSVGTLHGKRQEQILNLTSPVLNYA
ncbi:hypothetical protein [Paenibacillus sp. AN1007]|uniref:Uncharacterized protein n=1 Tax=Paenibacillus sp. AN1007 TaxID=3151385 RepID=A0AAU8NK10_9BACL